MGKMTAFICLLIGSSAFASTNVYDLKMELSVNGKPISSPKIMTKEGETASITQESNGEKIFMDVVATEKTTNGKQAILMKFVVGTLSATGEKKILASPQVITFENQKAEVTVKNQQKKEDLYLSVVATRKAL